MSLIFLIFNIVFTFYCIYRVVNLKYVTIKHCKFYFLKDKLLVGFNLSKLYENISYFITWNSLFYDKKKYKKTIIDNTQKIITLNTILAIISFFELNIHLWIYIFIKY